MLVLRFSSSPLTSALPELWFGVVKLFVVTVDVPFPGGGGSYSSVAVGPCLREVEATSAPPSSVLSPEGEGSLSLASPVLGVSVSVDWLWIPLVDRMWFSFRGFEWFTALFS
ncbi:unnamed protein product [Brassica rapa]|uniref:Uncharacterized protein n=2 Tax=Brassica TaxID=3705 RepID=A0A8D9HV01_BRACM|nr:unnamed protein product [Brassica napus]CAG7905924.1 unnamed protein product [Brassica rapa]